MSLSWLEWQSYWPTWLPMPESVLCSESNVLKNNLFKSYETLIIYSDVWVSRKLGKRCLVLETGIMVSDSGGFFIVVWHVQIATVINQLKFAKNAALYRSLPSKESATSAIAANQGTLQYVFLQMQSSTYSSIVGCPIDAVESTEERQRVLVWRECRSSACWIEGSAELEAL